VKFGSLRLRASLVVTLSMLGLVAVAAPVQAATPRAVAAPTEVSLVAGVNDPKDPNIAVLEFLPEKVKVATGTNVTWDIAGPEPHSVTFVPPGTTVPPSTESDPSLFDPTPATAPYDGTTLVNSGVLPLGETSQVQKFSMSFGKTGTYAYYCVLHPNMVGSITVTGDTQDSQQKITKTGNQEKAKYFKEGEAAKKKLTAAKPKQTKNSDGSSTYSVEMGATTAHTDVLAFAPTPRNAKTGDQVTFVNNSGAPHTASFGGELVPTVPTADNVVQPQPGPSPQALAQGVYLNTGWLPPKTKGGPPAAARSYTYSVPAPGKYQYVCVLHLPSGMAAEIDAS
jgi:plastocyanin